MNQLKKYLFLSAIICISLSQAYAANVPDWNSGKIEWNSYEQGLTKAKLNGKPIMLIFYADWCPTCHAYKNIFNKSTIIELAQKFVMIRANIDQYPELSKQFEFDGSYVPRSFVMSSEAVMFENLYSEKQYKYFFKSSDIGSFEQLMEKTLVLNNTEH